MWESERVFHARHHRHRWECQAASASLKCSRFLETAENFSSFSSSMARGRYQLCLRKMSIEARTLLKFESEKKKRKCKQEFKYKKVNQKRLREVEKIHVIIVIGARNLIQQIPWSCKTFKLTVRWALHSFNLDARFHRAIVENTGKLVFNNFREEWQLALN